MPSELELPRAQRVSKSSTEWVITGYQGLFRYVMNHGMLQFHWASSQVPFWIRQNNRNRNQVTACYGDWNNVASFERIE